MKKLIVLLPVFVLYICIFRFIYLEDGLTVINNVLLPIFVGIIIATLLNPFLVYLQKRLKIKNRHLAIFLTFLFIILIIAVIVTIITPNITKSIKHLIKDIPVLFYKAESYLSDFGDKNSILKSYLLELTYKFSSSMTSILNFAVEKVINIFAAIGNLLLAVIISIYILYDKEKIEMWLFKLCHTFFGKSTAREIFKIIHSLYDNISSYITGKIIASLITGFLVYAGSKYIIRNPYPVIDGMMIGVSNIIPYFGTLIGGIPVLLINVLYNSQKGFLMLIYLLIIQQIDNLVIDPQILSSKLEIKPLIIIISIIIGGGLFGAVGLFLATPVASLIKQLIDAYMDFKLKE
ncbi:AI-2E family transporter [Sedimentibacter sp.]|uniref:AI-2E family transporter n=1 Tax=Sedimentibacter sp. TaxID=1960295 RepID=UPI0028A21634|nr:AI-2E family transporter [Sedimentibacter sp.]